MAEESALRHATRIQTAIDANQAARSALIASWQRSMTLHRLEPDDQGRPHRLTARELTRAKEAMGEILSIGQRTLDSLHSALGESGCCVMLADRHGVSVERRGVAGDDATFESWGLWTGADWSEKAEGTNGIGTCLVEERALTIQCDQHYHTRNIALSCTAAPIYDHEGELAAVLDVSTCRHDTTASFLKLNSLAVRDAANRIESDHFRSRFSRHRILVSPAGEREGQSLLAVDEDDLVIGATRAARLAHGLGEGVMRGDIPAADLIAPKATIEGLGDSEKHLLRRVLARTGGNATMAAEKLGVSRATLYRKLRKAGLR